MQRETEARQSQCAQSPDAGEGKVGMRVGAEVAKPRRSCEQEGSGEEWEIHRGFSYNEGVEGPTAGVGIEAGQSESLQGEGSRVGSQGTGETPAFFKDTAHL